MKKPRSSVRLAPIDTPKGMLELRRDPRATILEHPTEEPGESRRQLEAPLRQAEDGRKKMSRELPGHNAVQLGLHPMVTRLW